MARSMIHSDEWGLYVRTGGYVFRPGAIRAYSHALRMDDAGLSKGDQVKAAHKGGTPLAKITLKDGATTYWCEEMTAVTDAVEAPANAKWKKDGSRYLPDDEYRRARANGPRAINVVTGEEILGIMKNAGKTP